MYKSIDTKNEKIIIMWENAFCDITITHTTNLTLLKCYIWDFFRTGTCINETIKRNEKRNFLMIGIFYFYFKLLTV